jgi:hypothetical protein
MKILRLPPVVIFLLMFIAPLFLVGPVRMLINIIFNEPDFSNLIILIGLHFFVCYCWEFAIGFRLSDYLPVEQLFRKRIYVLLFAVRVFLLMYVLLSSATAEDFDLLFVLSILPSMALWYALTIFVRYQNAKIVRAVELRREVSLPDVIIYFVLHNMLAVGVWVIQGSVRESLRYRASQVSGNVM